MSATTSILHLLSLLTLVEYASKGDQHLKKIPGYSEELFNNFRGIRPKSFGSPALISITAPVCPDIRVICRYISNVKSLERKCQLAVIGGGAGGCTIAAKFASKLGKGAVIVVEPSNKHYYQPMFTLIGGGMKKLEDSVRSMQCVLPKHADWIRDRAVKINAAENYIVTESNVKVNYDFLVVAAGLTLSYEKIPGLLEALSTENSGVCSNYSPDYVEKTLKELENFKEGNMVFTFPNTPVKCAGAPQKICYIAEEYLRKHGNREKANIMYNTALGVLFGVKKYADVLWEICDRRGIKVNLRTNLIEIVSDRKIARFQNIDKPNDAPIDVQYSFLHVTPPMSPPAVVTSCEGLSDASGYLAVNKDSLQHIKYDNVFGIGDCTNLPTSKTAAAVAAQSGVLSTNLSRRMAGLPPTSTYNGYTSCPLVTGYSTCVLAEFDYQSAPLETFPVDQGKERTSMFHLKKTIMPALYWNAMLRGYWNGPGRIRNIMRGSLKS